MGAGILETTWTKKDEHSSGQGNSKKMSKKNVTFLKVASESRDML